MFLRDTRTCKGLVWEIVEFYVIGLVQPELLQKYGRMDTVTDLIADSVGGVMAMWIVVTALEEVVCKAPHSQTESS